jgi:hypothetical protein
MFIREKGNIGNFLVMYKVRGDEEMAELLELVINSNFINYTSRNFKSNTDDNLLTAYVYMVYRDQHPHKLTVKDVLRDLKENNINVSQLVQYRTYHCHYGEYSTEGLSLGDTDVRNGMQPSAILNILDS